VECRGEGLRGRDKFEGRRPMNALFESLVTVLLTFKVSCANECNTEYCILSVFMAQIIFHKVTFHIGPRRVI